MDRYEYHKIIRETVHDYENKIIIKPKEASHKQWHIGF